MWWEVCAAHVQIEFLHGPNVPIWQLNVGMVKEASTCENSPNTYKGEAIKR